VRPTVPVNVLNVPAAAGVYGCPGCTRLASVSEFVGIACDTVPTGFRKLPMLIR
jgi:hypothetical protein